MSFRVELRRQPAGRGWPEGVQREITASREGERGEWRGEVMSRRVGKGVEGER